MLQSPTQIKELVKIFKHATKVRTWPSVPLFSVNGVELTHLTDGDRFLGDVQLELSLSRALRPPHRAGNIDKADGVGAYERRLLDYH